MGGGKIVDRIKFSNNFKIGRLSKWAPCNHKGT